MRKKSIRIERKLCDVTDGPENNSILASSSGRFVLSLGLIALCSMLFALPVEGKVKGKCKDCHTIHYSYLGADVTYGNRAGPFRILTKGGCMGCHGRNPAGAQNIIISGTTRVPQVIHRREEGDMAAGNFYYVADGYSPHYENGHNVEGISLKEKPPMDVPPGFLASVAIPGGVGPIYWAGQYQLTCAGTWGCHGDRTVADPYSAMRGAHHADDGTVDGTSVGTSYRFLNGVSGKEHKNWEYLATTDDHNGYKGDPSHESMNTISYLCGQCHGKFHPNANLGGSEEVGHAHNAVWRRHPSDISFSSVHGGFAGSEYQDYVSYSLDAPVANVMPTGTEKTVNEDSVIMCLSCHRAHASRYPDILRWEYSIEAVKREGSGKGCIVCHTEKAQ
ncbi:MAG: cytochrome c3 family protein [Nitrospirota bacterium]